MFSPVYFEKLDAYIERLDEVAELAYQHAKEIGLESPQDEDIKPVCEQCLKQRRLNFDSGLSTSENGTFVAFTSKNPDGYTYTYSEADTSRLSSTSTGLCDVTNSPKRGGNLRRNAERKIDSTFMSSMLKTLVTLNSSSDTLNRTPRLNRSVNETAKKKATFLRRRHTTILDENALMLSANASAAVRNGKQNTKAFEPCRQKGAEAGRNVVYRTTVSRKPRPCYPNRRDLERLATSPNLGCDNMPIKGANNTCEPALLREGQLTARRENADNTVYDAVDSSVSSQSVQDKLSNSTDVRTTSQATKADKINHHMYYSLSPALLGTPLRMEDLKMKKIAPQTKDGNADKTEGLSGEEHDENRDLSLEDLRGNGDTTKNSESTNPDSSLSPNPEYFSVISKSRKKRRGKRSLPPDGSRSLPAKNSNHAERNSGDIKSDKNSNAGDEAHTSARSDLPGRSFSHSLDDLRSGSDMTLDVGSMTNIIQDDVIDGSTSGRHGDGLLYTSSFGIGDHPLRSSLVESDLTKDGYCKCSFCNHDMIVTPMRGEMYEIPPRNDVFEKDFATVHAELQRLRSFSVTDDFMTSFHASQYETRTDLQTDHFPYPKLPKEFMTSQDEESMTSQLDISMEVACSDEESAPEDRKASRISPIQKALQRDIEKHSSGVASVLNLCEVLLHDGDACSSESEKDSIEQATNSLDRRWRNICSLSMERKLKIEETQRLWRKFLEDSSRFNDWLRSAGEVVKHPNTYMVSHQAAKEELRRFESFQRQVHESLTQLELINKQYRRLARENRTDATNKLKHMIQNGNSRWDALSHRVTCILRRLKHAIYRREDFETQRESLTLWLTETDLRLTNVEHFMQSENYDKLKEVKNFQAAIEEHIPRILDLHVKGQYLLEKCEEGDCVTVEEELTELHRYCREVIGRLDRYHKRLLRMMNEPPPLDSSLFEDSELAQMKWWESYISETSSSRNSSPAFQTPEQDRAVSSPTSQGSTKIHGSSGTHSGRATPESLEWDLYDISQSELETKDNGALTDDGSIPEISPLETAGDDVPLMHVSRDSTTSTSRQSNLNGSRRSHDTSRETDDLTPVKKPRRSQDEVSQQKIQFMNDLVATLAWLDATSKVTEQEQLKSESKFDKTVEQLNQEVKELRDLQKSIEQRRPIVLSINLVSSSYAESEDISMKLNRMNESWESLQQKALGWNKTLQEGLTHSQEFQSTVNEVSTWVDLQNHRRDDLVMIQQRESAESSPTSKMQSLKKDHKVLDQMRINTLKAISKVTTMQEVCIRLTSPVAGERIHRVDGVRGLSEKVRSTNGRLKGLLDAIRSDLRDMEHRIKAARRRVRAEKSSSSDESSSGDGALRSSTPIRLRMLQRKVEASELHSSGKNQGKSEMATVELAGDKAKRHYDITQDSYSSIDDVTHTSLHSRPRKVTKTKISPKTDLAKAVATKQTIVTGEKRRITVSMSATRKRTTRSVAAVSAASASGGGGAAAVLAGKNDKKAGLCCRVCFAALPFYFLILLLFILPWLFAATSDDGFGCLRQNNYAFSFTPMLTYTNGPPPM